MKNHGKKAGIALITVFGAIIIFNFVKGLLIKRFFANYTPPAVTVSSAIAKKVNWSPVLNAVGNFVAINGVEVNAQVSGNVVKIGFDSGQFVEKDTPLIEIDDSVDQAVLKANQSELAIKQLDFKRQSDLFKKGAAPVSSVDQASANLQQAKAGVEKTEALIKQKHIGAPFTGRLGIRQVNLGQYITPGQTSIVSLQSLDPLYLEFYLPEQLYKELHLNQPISFFVEEIPNVLFKGTITAIDSKVETTNHNIKVQATLPNCPLELLKDPQKSALAVTAKEEQGQRLVVQCDSEKNLQSHIKDYFFIPGMFASIEIKQKPKPNTVIVPSTAISYSLYGDAIYVIEKNKDGKKNGDGSDLLTVNRIFIKAGDQHGNYTVIEQGINAGQLIVQTGDIKLQNDTPVAINNSVVLQDELNPDSLGQ